MALVSCPECDGQVSTAADKCPHCGYPVGAMKASAGESTGSAKPAPSTPATEHEVTSQDLYAAADRAQRRVLLIGILALSAIGGGWYAFTRWRAHHEDQDLEGDQHEWKSRMDREDELRRQRARFEYYCFTIKIGAAESKPCLQGPETCDDRRVRALREVSGARVSECARQEYVFAFNFACHNDPASTCYEARDTFEQCNEARERYVATANNLTACTLTRSGP